MLEVNCLTTDRVVELFYMTRLIQSTAGERMPGRRAVVCERGTKLLGGAVAPVWQSLTINGTGGPIVMPAERADSRPHRLGRREASDQSGSNYPCVNSGVVLERSGFAANARHGRGQLELCAPVASRNDNDLEMDRGAVADWAFVWYFQSVASTARTENLCQWW